MLLKALGWRRKVTMPRLIFGALEWHIEADLHDLIVRPEYGFTHGSHPWVGGEVGEAAERLRMRFDVPATRAAANRAARSLYGLPESSHHFFAQLLHPLTRAGRLK